MGTDRVRSRRRYFRLARRAARVLAESMIPRAPAGLHLRERFLGLVLIAAGTGALFLLYAFWRSGYASPVTPPVPEPIPVAWSFAFNPLVWAVPFIGLGAMGLVYVGVRLLIKPYDG